MCISLFNISDRNMLCQLRKQSMTLSFVRIELRINQIINQHEINSIN